MSTTTRTRNAQGQFVKVTTRKTTAKPAVEKVDPAKVERDLARAERIESLSQGLTVAQASAAYKRAQRELRGIQASGEKGYVRAAARVSTAKKVLDLVSARSTTRPAQKRGRTTTVAAKRTSKSLVNA